ncbi:MAG TPA: 1-acyl-sn-glycerol-3-phosphate acyltransferase [Leeuwenhoekiella sp.]|nr:1-acyl-sn-glycerol-3-phosphate acyltransferase [Leeuwenhoekiella sp.]
MKPLRKLAIFLYRMWFYVLVVIPIFAMLPLLLISVLRKSWYPMFYRLAQFWARFILYGSGFFPQIKRMQHTVKGKSYMFIANHTSIVDIMLMLHCVRQPFVFVGKQELARFPLFGFLYRRTCILVDRNDVKSRRAVFENAQKKLKMGWGICIFPEGKVPDDYNLLIDTFKDGAFRLAIEHQIPIVPLVFYDNKKRFSYKSEFTSPGKMRVKVLPFIETKGMQADARRDLRDHCHVLIKEELIKEQQF